MRRSVAIFLAGGAAGTLAAYTYRRLRGSVSDADDDHAAVTAQALGPPSSPKVSGDDGSNADPTFAAALPATLLAAREERSALRAVAPRAPVEGARRDKRGRSRRVARVERLSSSMSPLLLVAAALNAALLVAVLVLGGGGAHHHVESWLQLIF